MCNYVTWSNGKECANINAHELDVVKCNVQNFKMQMILYVILRDLGDGPVHVKDVMDLPRWPVLLKHLPDGNKVNRQLPD